jgi:hypothetical protein
LVPASGAHLVDQALAADRKPGQHAHSGAVASPTFELESEPMIVRGRFVQQCVARARLA